MSNSGLNAAKAKKYDEFYTRRQDIEAELRFYRDEFAGKTVYCNCDDPWESEFVQYFCRNFRELGLRKLMATHYEPNKENHSYSISIDGDSDGDGEVTVADLVKTELVCNGDFRSRECIELLDEADIVVTNPPFSLFREYMAQLIEHDKKFLIIGNKTACKAKEIFPYIKDEKVWLGRSIHSGGMWMRLPKGTQECTGGRRVHNCKCCWRSLVHQSKVCSASGRSFPGRKLLFSRSESKVFELRCD